MGYKQDQNILNNWSTWYLGGVVLLSMYFVVFFGLKFKWFRAQLKFDKLNKISAAIPEYKHISASSQYGEYKSLTENSTMPYYVFPSRERAISVSNNLRKIVESLNNSKSTSMPNVSVIKEVPEINKNFNEQLQILNTDQQLFDEEAPSYQENDFYLEQEKVKKQMEPIYTEIKRKDKEFEWPTSKSNKLYAEDVKLEDPVYAQIRPKIHEETINLTNELSEHEEKIEDRNEKKKTKFEYETIEDELSEEEQIKYDKDELTEYKDDEIKCEVNKDELIDCEYMDKKSCVQNVAYSSLATNIFIGETPTPLPRKEKIDKGDLELEGFTVI